VAAATSLAEQEKLAAGTTSVRLVPLAQRRWTPRLPSFTERSSGCLAASTSTRPCFTGVCKRSFGARAVEVAASSKSNFSVIAMVGSTSWSPSHSSLPLSSIGGGRAGSPSGNVGPSRACGSSCLASRLGGRSHAPAALTPFLAPGLIHGWLDAGRCTRARWRGSPGRAGRGARRRDASERFVPTSVRHSRRRAIVLSHERRPACTPA
jgi:hypothetical protein